MTLAGTRHRERGSSLIEAAIVTLPFMIILFAVFEFGLLSRNNLTTTNASREGGRAASVFGNDGDADYFTLQTIKHAVEPMGVEHVEFVVIYRVNEIGDPMNPSCLTGSVTLVDPLNPPTGTNAQPCNHYTQDQLQNAALLDSAFNPTGEFGCGPIAIDRFWCPSDREVSLSAQPDLVGVYVQTNHDYVTKFFGDSRTLQEETVIQIEPEEQ